jgi:hypothetical protein
VRITPVTGDLPALATSPPPPARLVAAPPAPETIPVAHAAATDADTGTATGDRQRPAAQPFFDPPLIAQRAVLGLPTGFLIADFARTHRVPFLSVAAAVEREMPRDVD